jgi:hypothetical protein
MMQHYITHTFNDNKVLLDKSLEVTINAINKKLKG